MSVGLVAGGILPRHVPNASDIFNFVRRHVKDLTKCIDFVARDTTICFCHFGRQRYNTNGKGNLPGRAFDLSSPADDGATVNRMANTRTQ